MSQRPSLPIYALALVVVAAAVVAACVQVTSDVRVFTPTWVAWGHGAQMQDLDGDGSVEEVLLDRGRVEVREGGRTRCETPRSWAVSDVFCADMDGQPGAEVTMLAWKRGSYGTSRPFWVEFNDNDLEQHVFIFRYAEGELQPLWMSSSIGANTAYASMDERAYLHLVSLDGDHTVWQWDEWGLVEADDGMVENGPVAERPGAGDVAPEGDVAAEEAGPASVELVAVGDNIVHDSLYEQMRVDGAGSFDFTPVYEHVRGVVSDADIAAVVQETPLVQDSADYGGYPYFGTPTAAGDALAQAGFDVVCAATNHALDRGDWGVRDTMQFWKAYPQVTLLGMHDAREQGPDFAVRTANGVRIALLDFTYGLNEGASAEGEGYRIDEIGDGSLLQAQVREAEDTADVSVCFLHVGEEYADLPTEEQRTLVERLVDAGADIVICSHPHVVQPMEHMETPAGARAVVYWSLGNFASHQLELRTIVGGMARVTVERAGDGRAHVTDCALEPLVCHYTGETTAVYPLADYTEDLAASHYLNSQGQDVSLASLWATWSKQTEPASIASS